MKLIKKGHQRLFLKICALFGNMIFSKPFAILSAIVFIYTLGGLTAHKVADEAIAFGNRCTDKCNGYLEDTAVAFRLEKPTTEIELPQEFVPKAVLVDGVLTPEGNEEYFLQDGTVLPPPEGSEAEQMQVNLPAY